MFNPAHFHPMLVHFPIAMLLVGFMADLAGEIFKKENWLHKMGYTLQLFGTLSVLAAFVSGDQFTNWENFTGTTREAFLIHQESAVITLWIVIAATIIRSFVLIMQRFSGWLKWLSMFFFFAGVISIARTGFLGGDLVFNFLIGI